jgi:hypothetical protein
MSHSPKIAEVCKVIYHANVDLIYITEMWLREYIHDNIVEVPGYNLVRRDMTNGQHVGACMYIMYIKSPIQFKILEHLMDSKFEVIWAQIRKKF